MPGNNRGRGQGRGRGVGRGNAGRRGRGRGAFRGRGRGRMDNQERREDWEILPSGGQGQGDSNKDIQYDIDRDVTVFFVGTAGFEEHFKAQNQNRHRYAAAMTVLESNGVEISQNARVRALAAAWARRDYELSSWLLRQKNMYGLVEVLKSLSLLDAGRCIRVLEKRIKRLQMSESKVSPRKMGKLKSDIDNFTAVKPQCGSASGAVCRHIQRWVRTLTKQELEFAALHLPREPWRKLADICHFNPSKDFAALPWFLTYVFEGKAPEGSMVQSCQGLDGTTVNDLLKEYPIPYSHVRTYKDSITEDSMGRIAAYSHLDHVLWYYEELQCQAVDRVLSARLDAGDPVTLPLGKLLERLLRLKMIREDISLTNVEYEWHEETEELLPRQRKPDPNKAPFFSKIIPLAQQRMEEVSLPLESPIVVMGDRSGSMDVAIRVSTILASILTAVTSARLVFFNNETTQPEVLPTNIEEVLEVAVSVEADGCTSPAAGLYPFYEKKEVVKTFILVTDEEENEDHKGYSFLELYRKYSEEVHPARLVFVSFLADQHATGKMVSELTGAGFKPLQFNFNATKPDLTKLDKLFGLLSSETGCFEERLVTQEATYTAGGFKDSTAAQDQPTAITQ